MSQRRRYNGSARTIEDSPPSTLAKQVCAYIRWLRVRNYSVFTARQKTHHLRRFVTWCETAGHDSPGKVTKAHLEEYQSNLYDYRQRNGKALSFQSQRGHLMSVQLFFAWLCKTNRLRANPSTELELPKINRNLPKAILSAGEVESILWGMDINSKLGLRDRTIIETMYSTGMRRLELVNLELRNIDFERCVVLITSGKGQRDRVVPLGTRARRWIEKYMTESRARLTKTHSGDHLFLSITGDALSPGALSNIVRAHIRKAGIDKPGACHLFRHTMATLMLENGADIRYIQQILGHAKLETTQIYTHVSIPRLVEVHRATHPAR